MESFLFLMLILVAKLNSQEHSQEFIELMLTVNDGSGTFYAYSFLSTIGMCTATSIDENTIFYGTNNLEYSSTSEHSSIYTDIDGDLHVVYPILTKVKSVDFLQQEIVTNSSNLDLSFGSNTYGSIFDNYFDGDSNEKALNCCIYGGICQKFSSDFFQVTTTTSTFETTTNGNSTDLTTEVETTSSTGTTSLTVTTNTISTSTISGGVPTSNGTLVNIPSDTVLEYFVSGGILYQVSSSLAGVQKVTFSTKNLVFQYTGNNQYIVYYF